MADVTYKISFTGDVRMADGVLVSESGYYMNLTYAATEGGAETEFCPPIEIPYAGMDQGHYFFEEPSLVVDDAVYTAGVYVYRRITQGTGPGVEVPTDPAVAVTLVPAPPTGFFVDLEQDYTILIRDVQFTGVINNHTGPLPVADEGLDLKIDYTPPLGGIGTPQTETIHIPIGGTYTSTTFTDVEQDGTFDFTVYDTVTTPGSDIALETVESSPATTYTLTVDFLTLPANPVTQNFELIADFLPVREADIVTFYGAVTEVYGHPPFTEVLPGLELLLETYRGGDLYFSARVAIAECALVTAMGYEVDFAAVAEPATPPRLQSTDEVWVTVLDPNDSDRVYRVNGAVADAYQISFDRDDFIDYDPGTGTWSVAKREDLILNEAFTPQTLDLYIESAPVDTTSNATRIVVRCNSTVTAGAATATIQACNNANDSDVAKVWITIGEPNKMYVFTNRQRADELQSWAVAVRIRLHKTESTDHIRLDDFGFRYWL